MGRVLLRLPNVKRLFSFWSSKIFLHEQDYFHGSKPHCVCMARLSFTYKYGSSGICKGKLSRRKSNNFKVSFQKHRATSPVQTVQSFQYIPLHEVTRLFGLRLKASFTLLSLSNVLYEFHFIPLHTKISRASFKELFSKDQRAF